MSKFTEYQARRRARGDKRVGVWLSAEEQEMVDELRYDEGLSAEEAIRRAIRAAAGGGNE